jgi:DNA polymerase-3 subunit delta
LRPAYLLAGEEPLLRDDALEALTEAVLDGAPADFNRDRLEGATTSAARLLDAVRTLPVLGARRLVLLREPETRRAGAKGLAQAVTQAVSELAAGAAAVLVVTAERVDRRSAWVRAFADPAALVACDPPRRARELEAFLRAEADRQELDLDPRAAELLLERIGPQLLLLRQELAKAALYAGPGQRIQRSHVAEVASDVAEEPVWELTDAIGEGRSADALMLLTRMTAAGTASPLVLATLASHFRRLARVCAGGEVAGPPFVRRKLEAQARRYSSRRIVTCLRAIHQTDEALKGQGVLPPDLALERLVLGLSA